MEKGSADSGPELPSSSQTKEMKCATFKLVVVAIVMAASIVIATAFYIGFGGAGAKGNCDLFKGRWIRNPSGPSYNNKSCHFIDDSDNCLKNGRPDTDYLYWRWQPDSCELPQFDAGVFMNGMRSRSWAFVGDSIIRNQMQSFVCLLSKIEEPVEIYHDEAYKCRTFYFPNHNLTIATTWAPLLVKSVTNVDDDGKSSAEIQLHLDALDTNWTTNYCNYDYIVISGGQWFLKSAIFFENTTTIGCHNCADKKLNELGIFYPYHKALQLALSFIASSNHKPFVFFRTWTTDHFEHGKWFSGGVCNRSEPYKEGEFQVNPTDNMMRTIELEEFKKAKAVALRRGVEIEILDIFHLSLLRPDGHPGPYRYYHPFDKDKHAKVQNDCLHWCVPGPVDTWNELMMKVLLDAGVLKSIKGFPHVSFQ